MIKKYWLHIIIIFSVVMAFAALMNYDTIIAASSYAGLFIFSAYAGIITARYFFKWLKKRSGNYV